MTQGYKIFRIEPARSELEETIEYIRENWTDKELSHFSRELDLTLELIPKSPK